MISVSSKQVELLAQGGTPHMGKQGLEITAPGKPPNAWSNLVGSLSSSAAKSMQKGPTRAEVMEALIRFSGVNTDGRAGRPLTDKLATDFRNDFRNLMLDQNVAGAAQRVLQYQADKAMQPKIEAANKQALTDFIQTAVKAPGGSWSSAVMNSVRDKAMKLIQEMDGDPWSSEIKNFGNFLDQVLLAGADQLGMESVSHNPRIMELLDQLHALKARPSVADDKTSSLAQTLEAEGTAKLIGAAKNDMAVIRNTINRMVRGGLSSLTVDERKKVVGMVQQNVAAAGLSGKLNDETAYTHVRKAVTTVLGEERLDAGTRNVMREVGQLGSAYDDD